MPAPRTTGTPEGNPERPAHLRTRYLVGGFAAALVASLAALALWNTLRDDDPRPALITPSPTAVTDDLPDVADAPPSPALSDTAVAGSRPAWFVGVTEDGRLVVVDTASGEQRRELDAMDDPTEESDEEPPLTQVITEVTLAPDRQTVYYSDCCEPAVGSIYRMPVDGGQRERVSEGHDAAVSPDGTRLAAAHVSGILVLDIAGGERFVIDDPDRDGLVGHPAWSPDGSMIAWDRGTEPEGAGEVIVAEAVEGATPRILTTSGARPAWRSDGLLVVNVPDARAGSDDGSSQSALVDPDTGEVVEPFWAFDGRVVSRDYDPARAWLLTVLRDGEVLAVSDGGQEPVASGFVNAAW